MSLHKEVELYSRLTGKNGYKTSISVIGAYLDGYEKGKAEAQSEQHWILCSERLPETEEWRTEYLVTADCGYDKPIPKTLCMDWENTTVRGKPVSRWIWRDCLSPYKVIAWAEKPEPWEGEQS